MAQALNEKTSEQRKPRHVGLIVLAIVIFVPFCTFAYWVLTHKPDVSRMTHERYDAALKKWNAAGVSDYNMDLDFTGGDQHNKLHIEVRNNQLTKHVQNELAVPVTRNRWTMTELFEMIAQDLAKADIPHGFDVRDNVIITLHGEFDPEYGYPQHYHRKARGKTPLASHWTITKFERVTSGSQDSQPK